MRFSDQATFGATEPLLAEIRSLGYTGWISAQMALPPSRYTSGMDASVHQYTGSGDFCATKGPNCWRDWQSSQPLLWDFYRNAVSQPDQLRQRVTLALQQIAVVNDIEVSGTYGLRNYHNNLMDLAFGNYRQVLKKVALSPVMGDFLNNANNDKAAPNENFAREMLQLFSLGTCELNPDATLKSGACIPTYTNETVRNYAYAMTGWTYPAGGATPWGCWPTGANCQFYAGDMVPFAALHDANARQLLSGISSPAGSTAPVALERVLDSIMAHPNIAPFISKQLIQHLALSNPSPAFVARVSSAFTAGKFGQFGTGQKGDMAATVAAILLDPEARALSASRSAGKLREPALLFTGAIRGLNGKTDGDALGWWWGDALQQHMFRAPSVFNFYPPNYPVAGTSLYGPSFGIHNTNSALERLNFMTYLLDWNGSDPSADIPNALGTRISTAAFQADADDAGKLLDRISLLALGQPFPAAARDKAITAVAYFTSANAPTNWRDSRVRAAAFLVYASPQYQISR